MWRILRDAFLGNWGLKITSLVLAFLLYGYVRTEEERDAVLALPVQVTGLSDSLCLAGPVPDPVRVRVLAKWKDVIRLELQRPPYRVDLAAAQPGRFQMPVTVGDIRERALTAAMAPALRVDEVLEPRAIDLAIDVKERRRIPVRPELEGWPAAGRAVTGSPRVEPDSVWLEGPRSIVALVEEIATLPVDIDGERERIQRQVDLAPPPEATRLTPHRVTVSVEIGKR